MCLSVCLLRAPMSPLLALCLRYGFREVGNGEGRSLHPV